MELEDSADIIFQFRRQSQLTDLKAILSAPWSYLKDGQPL